MIIKISNKKKRMKTYSIEAIEKRLERELFNKLIKEIKKELKKYDYFEEIFPTEIIKENKNFYEAINKKINEKNNIKKNKTAIKRTSQYIGRVFQSIIYNDKKVKYIEYSKKGYVRGNKAYIKVK